MEKEVKVKFSTLYIDPIVMRRIMYYTEAADGEVSGLGVVKIDDKGRHIVSKVHLLEQESSGADTELKPEAISELMVDMMKKDEDPGLLKFWWHSHANMSVFWSGTDDTCAETLSHEYAFSLVVNKAGDRKCRLDLYNPFRITIDNIRIEELKIEDAELKEECAKEVKEKVKPPYYHGYRRNYNDDDMDVYHGFGHNRWNERGFEKKDDTKSRVTVPKYVTDDVKELLKLIQYSSYNDGGMLSVNVWKEYIINILKSVVVNRLDKDASCTTPVTFSNDWKDCSGKCKVKKACAYWTRFLNDAERDIIIENGVNRDVDIIIG